MDYRPSTEFGALASELLADLERLRPGLPPNASTAEIRRLCGERLSLRLPEIYREYQADAPGPEDNAQLELYQREMDQLLLPRYVALAERQNQLERKAGAGRHPTLYNGLAYTAIFFLIGVFVVWAPFIPIWDKWIPFVLALVAPLLSPWLPNLYLMMTRQRHDVALGLLKMDIDQAGRSLPLPPAPALLPEASETAARAHAAAERKASRDRLG